MKLEEKYKTVKFEGNEYKSSITDFYPNESESFKKVEEIDVNIYGTVKFGRSEHKRFNITDFYLNAAKSFKNLEGININDNKKIYKELLDNKIYKKDKFIKKIGREISFFKNSFPLYDTIDNKIKITKLTKNILEFTNEKIFNGKDYFENSMILFLIKEYPSKNINENPFFYAINLVKKKDISKENFSLKIFKMNENNIKKDLMEISFNDAIKKYFKYRSGNPNPKKDKDLIKFQSKKNELIKLLLEYVFYKIDIKKIVDYLYEFIKDYEYLKNKKLISNFPKAYKKIFNLNETKIFSFIKNFENNNINGYINFIKEKINIDYLIENFYFENKKSDYINLIDKYLFFTEFFVIEKNSVKINKVYKEYIDDLRENYDEILRISLKNDNIIEKLLKLDFKNKENYFSIRKIILNNYNDAFFDAFFDIFLNPKKDINKDLMKLSLENNHINNILDPPTFFEFIINLFFFKLFYEEKILNDKNYSDNYLTNEFRKSINTYLSTNLIPRRFASGNKSDGIFYEEKILIEPSLQLKNQIKHELSSILNHLKKSDFKTSVFISPQIEEDFLIQSISYKYKNLLILPISIKILKKINDSNCPEKLFYQIKKEFLNCVDFNQVLDTYNKYNF
jgi:hypothetical protein